MQKDAYFCLNCNHKGSVNGIITMLTPCEKCDSLLIVPVASMHLLEIDRLTQSLPALIAEDSQYKRWKGKKHLRIVPSDADAVTKNGTGGNNEAKKE